MVSLALALGLSHMASQNVRVDSLFLDEGFGTLDSELLDKVVGSLEKLSMERIKVGFITHVEELKSRIPLKIEVMEAIPGERGTIVKMV